MNEELLMNVEFVRGNIMQYRGQEFRYELDEIESETDEVRQQDQSKTYRRKRSLHSKRRRGGKPTNHPGCGIGARRNHRWTW
jgi:hypothetical protein